MPSQKRHRHRAAASAVPEQQHSDKDNRAPQPAREVLPAPAAMAPAARDRADAGVRNATTRSDGGKVAATTDGTGAGARTNNGTRAGTGRTTGTGTSDAGTPGGVRPHRPVAAAPRRRAAIPRPPGAAGSPGRPADEGAEAPPAVTSVSTQAAADALAARLLAPGRQRPIVVVTVPGGLREPRFDVDQLAAALAGLAEIAVVRTESAAWRLSEKLPAARVYGGAGRAYPVGLGWTYDDSLAPLRLPLGEDDRRATDAIQRDALSMATVLRDGTSFVLPAHARPARGVVKALFPPSRAMVVLTDGSLATISQELTAKGVEIDRLLEVGQQVRGMWDREAKRLHIREMLIPGAESVAQYEAGDVVLTQVTAIGTDVVQLALVPSVVVDVPRDNVTSNPLDSMTALFTVGETVLARIEAIDGTTVALRLDDIEDDEEALPAPPLIKGGLSWLVEPDRRAVAAPEPTSQGARSAPPAAEPGPSEEAPGRAGRAPTPLDLDRSPGKNGRGTAEATELRAVQEHARALEAQVLDLSAKVQNQRTIMRQEKLRYQALVRKRARAGDDGAASPIDAPPAFSDPVEQFTFEVYVEWAARIPAADKAYRALAPYSLSEDFLASIDSVEIIERRKVVQVVVEVITGLAEELDSREVHPLRNTAAGGSGQLMRDGWAGWRAALKRKSPSAPRIHYWRKGPEFELARVVIHDDLRT